MRVLFDQGTPVPLRQHLGAHTIETAYERGWSTMKNGDLLRLAEEQRFEVMITTDTNLKYQQNLSSRLIAIVVLGTTSWPRIRAASAAIAAAVDSTTPSSYVEVAIP